MALRNKYVPFVLISLLIATFVIRLTGLTFSPPGFFCDETSIGYNAYSILETGKDEKGITMPVFFKAFGDFKNPVYVYLATIPIKLFGLNVFAVRLTSAFLGIFSIILFIYFLYLLKRGWVFALAGGFILSLIPWHFQFSRIAFEAISMVFFIILDMVLFARFIHTKKPLYYLFFVLSMLLTFFTYSTGRLIVPMSAILIVMIWREEILKKRITILMSILATALLGLILVYDHFIDPAGILTRPHDVLITDDSPSFYVLLERFFENYTNHFSPSFLFGRGDLNLRHSPGISSMLFTSFFLPLLVGLAYSIKKFKSSKLAAFTAIQFFAFPLASSITVIDEGAQATRTIHVVPFLALLITYGFWKILEILEQKHKNLIAVILLFSLFEAILFYKYYFSVYPTSQGTIYNFEGGMPEALEFAFSQKAPFYYISSNVCKYRIEIPFFMKYPPKNFQESLIFPNARCLYPLKLSNPIEGSIAVYKAGDPIKHFPGEELIKKISYNKKTVRQEPGTSRELYENKEIDLYYIYKY